MLFNMIECAGHVYCPLHQFQQDGEGSSTDPFHQYQPLPSPELLACQACAQLWSTTVARWPSFRPHNWKSTGAFQLLRINKWAPGKGLESKIKCHLLQQCSCWCHIYKVIIYMFNKKRKSLKHTCFHIKTSGIMDILCMKQSLFLRPSNFDLYKWAASTAARVSIRQ